ncbi:MAG: SDR family oxidoreductase [Phycisphaerales bacterium]|nr:MAG: SDR family oxidoreductase [Phycisphaerales bacterium]
MAGAAPKPYVDLRPCLVWNDRDAARALSEWGPRFGVDVALRLYSARLIGLQPGLVLLGGGNVSVKGRRRDITSEELDAIYVKASGHELAALTPDGLPGLDLASLRTLRRVPALTDAQLANELRRRLFDASAPTPSIETLVHAFLPHKFVDHSHADAVLVLTNQADGEALIREALGDGVGILPYVYPGFDLARAIADYVEAHPFADALVLMHHGLVTFADDAKSSYQRHFEIVETCARFASARAAARRPRVSTPPADAVSRSVIARTAAILRGVLAVPSGDEDRPHHHAWLQWIGDADGFACGKDGPRLAATGPLTGDHVIYTRPRPLFVPDPAWDDPDRLRLQLAEAVAAWRKDYLAYFHTHAGADATPPADGHPNVVWLGGGGGFCRGGTTGQLFATGTIALHTAAAQLLADAVGAFTPLPDADLFRMEYRQLQQAKLAGAPRGVLAGMVVAISGAGGAIGSGIAQACARAGACVLLADVDMKAADRVKQRLQDRYGRASALSVAMDVTDEASVRAGFEEACLNWGGVDVVVANAGVAHVSSIEDMDVAAFRRVLEINAVGYLTFIREGVRIMKLQRLGGHVIINASKNVFAPGKQFGAYSASKAAGHQLGKVAALELAEHGIRVNMINADAVFDDDGDVTSGLWAAVGPDRAAARGLKPEDLPEFYRQRNLLGLRVRAHHVGAAVVFLASNATPTTGATIPIDGGIPEAFPR